MRQTGFQLASMDEENQLIQQQEEDTNIPGASHANLPCLDLLTGDRENYIKIGLPLYKASVKGDWEAAKVILGQKPELVRYSLTENGDTPLHVVAAAQPTIEVIWFINYLVRLKNVLASAKQAKQVKIFVENLVRLMTRDELALENKNRVNALYLACVAGNIETVKVLVEKNSALLIHAGIQGKKMPLQAAVLYGNHEVVKYLYEKSSELPDDGWTHENRSWLLLKCVETDMFDIALRIVKKYPQVGSSGSVLGVLARKPEAFQFQEGEFGTNQTSIVEIIKGIKNDRDQALQLLRIIWGNISKKPKKVIDDILRGPPDLKQDNKLVSGNTDETYSSRILFVAAEMGNTIFIVELIRQYPDLIWQVNDNNQSIFHIAIQNRHEDIYNLLYEIGGMKDMITHLRDEQGNNMLHIVAKSVNQRRLKVQGAFQMQRELQWFVEIERMIPHSYREQKNNDGLTPRELFTEEHKSLHAQAEDWMKATANQSMVIAVLVATIAFAAAFTIPGGYDQNNGIPMFRSNKFYLVFVISDAISLISSSTSIILMFLTILMSPYAEKDFLLLLPLYALLGLATLFLSLSTMLIAFCAGLFVLYDKQLICIPFLIVLFSSYPISLYGLVQINLFVDVIRSTFDTRFLFNPYKRVLY